MKNVLIPENQQSIENRLIEVSHFLDSLGFSRCGTYEQFDQIFKLKYTYNNNYDSKRISR